MNHEELLQEQNNVLLHPVLHFKVELNGLYNKLCFSIYKSKKSLPLVLNVIKLARSQKNSKALYLAATSSFHKKRKFTKIIDFI